MVPVGLYDVADDSGKPRQVPLIRRDKSMLISTHQGRAELDKGRTDPWANVKMVRICTGSNSVRRALHLNIQVRPSGNTGP